ncbi:hypothetical protein DH86_00001036 [Scytalidium sp. 3C]|nr:hypothetical protein DH86_00001036 [Scytalidium sp. 3C]
MQDIGSLYSAATHEPPDVIMAEDQPRRMARKGTTSCTECAKNVGHNVFRRHIAPNRVAPGDSLRDSEYPNWKHKWPA